MNSSSVTEIAVRQVKTGKLNVFKARRSKFIKVLKRQPGIVADREFTSFYALPEPDKSEVFIGMTTYTSLKAQAAIQRKLSVLLKFMPFFMTMKLKAYVYVQPIEGPDFNLKTLAAQPQQVLEVAVRRVAPAKQTEFQRTRHQFIKLLNQQSGVLASYEFNVLKGQKAADLTVGMTVYADRAAFERVSAAMMQNSVTQAYFATFEPVAVQYATSTTNT